MSDATYKVTEVVGTSTESIQQAVRNGITRASQTVRNLDWFEVTEIRGHVVNGDVGHFQVTMKIGFSGVGEQSPGPCAHGSHTRARSRRKVRPVIP